MNEVLDKDFNDVYPQLKKLISNASFIAIDTELTGINTDHDVKYSFFDSLDERYKTMKNIVENFSIIQYGITVFHHIPDMNCYDAQCFNFYLLPRPLPFKNTQITWQVTALEFLSENNFDFNKLINQGISYLNQPDEQCLKQYLEKNNLINETPQLSYKEETILKECVNKTLSWFTDEPHQNSLQFEIDSPFVQYIVQKKIRDSINSVQTIPGYKTVSVKRVPLPTMQNILKEEGSDYLEKILVDSYVGFSKVIKLLFDSKKPIVGHNVLFDLMFTYQQFYKPLPNTYVEFKNSIHSLFPQIYDTKFLSTELKRLRTSGVSWKQSSLNNIYEYFTSDRGKQLTLNSPSVNINHTPSDDKHYHNAGWDAYFAGFVFIKLGHVFGVNKYGRGLEERPITHSELVSSMKDFVNSINISRINEMCIKLDGPELIYSKPEWLHVKLKSPLVDTKQLVEKFSSFGVVDVMPYTNRRVLVAVSNRKSTSHILQHFQSSKEFQVTRYNRIRHAAPITMCLWSGIILSGGVFAWIIKEAILKFT